MIQKVQLSLIRFVYILIDIIFIFLSIYLACLLRNFSLKFPITFTNLFFGQVNPFRSVFLFWTLVIVILNKGYGLYQTRREINEGIEIWMLIKSLCLSTLITIVGVYLAKVVGLPRSVFGWGILFMIFFLSLWRFLKRLFVNYLVAGGYNNFNAVIIGAGKVGLALAEEINKRPTMGIRVVGFLDDFKIENGHASAARILGKITDFSKIARSEFINKIFKRS